MRKPSVGIVGLGVVGSVLKKTFDWAVCYDKYIAKYKTAACKKAVSNADIVFICVPTPNKNDFEFKQCDIAAVEKVTKWLESDVIVIKSTAPVGTTDGLIELTKKSICFSPEYHGATQHSHPDSNFVILGGERSITNKVAQLYQLVYSGELRILQTDARTAELVKYMENAYLATKVVFCNEFYRIANAAGVDYAELRELFLLDSRINRSHTFVYEDQPYYNSHCLDKDLPALVHSAKAFGYDPLFIEQVIETNRIFKDTTND